MATSSSTPVPGEPLAGTLGAGGDPQGQGPVLDDGTVGVGVLFAPTAPPLIDVRTAEEYAQGHIPGAVSFPALDRAEHAQVSIIYYRDGIDAARDHALALAAPKVRALVATCLKLSGSGDSPSPVIYCWRGGMRSQTAAGVLRQLGIPVRRLTGGYRAHRRYVLEYLAHGLPCFVVLHGYTGSGKTRALRTLAGSFRTLDLEGLACHRGSTLGHVGLPEQPCQRLFEARIVHALRALAPGSVLVEAESPTIGKLYLPTPLLAALRSATHVFLDVPFEDRARLLTDEYAPALRAGADINVSLRYLERRLSPARIKELRQLIDAGDLIEFTRRLLRLHYDPLYERWRAKRAGRTFAATVKVSRIEDTLAALTPVLRRLMQAR